MHQDEILLLALLQAVEPKTVELSLGKVDITAAIEELRERVEKNISEYLQRAAEVEANKVLGKPDLLGQLFGF